MYPESLILIQVSLYGAMRQLCTDVDSRRTPSAYAADLGPAYQDRA